jgi:ATP-dependent exoDNAse (exonuclease V) beta subunit
MLSEKQIAAAHRLDQDVCVVAGPGSGKTSVLIERFSWLVTEKGISPHRILAITFTEKAATEIKQRMTKRFEQNAAMREQIERAYVSTIHAFCARLLRENAIAAAVDPQFEVLDWAPADRLLREVTDEVLESIYTTSPERMRHFLRSLAVATSESIYEPDLAKSLMAMYAAMRIAGVPISAEAINRPRDSGHLARFRELLHGTLADQPRVNTTNQRIEHEKLNSWARKFLSLPDAATKDHFNLLNEKFNKGAFVKNSFSRDNFDEFRGLVQSIHSHLLMDFYAADRELVLESLREIDRVYRERKRTISALDFDDLEEFAIKLLESNEQLRTRVSTQFDFILMDELQDTNPLQWRLLKLIRRPNNFFAVGDVNQSIFGFRHAEPELFLNYRLALEAGGYAIDELRDNYRTIPEVVDVVNHVFNGAPGIEPHTLVAMRATGSTALKAVQVIAAQGETAEPAERLEAQTIAVEIRELVGRGEAAYRDIAILTRANIATAALQNALDDAGVPSIVLGGLTLFETREIRDLVLLLAVIVNPRNEMALAGVLRSPLFGISDEELFAMTQDRTLAEAVEQGPPRGWDLIVEIRAVRNSISPDRLLRRVLDAVDYESGLSSRARANIEKFLAGLRSRYEGSPAPLSTILNEIESAAPDSEAPPADFGDAVRLMTIHKSKGLEFPVVFLPFLHSSRGTGFPVVSYSHEYGLGIKWRDPATRRGAPDAIHAANQQQSDARQAAEDNRVLYVGMTRAKDRLVLSFSDTKFSRGKWSELIKSKLPVETIDTNVTRANRAATVRERTADAVILTKPTPTGQRDATASVTDISVFAQCPRRYYLGRYLGFKTPPTGTTGAIEIGNQTHDLLAGKAVENPHTEAQALARVFQSSALGKQAASASRKGHEYDFVFALDDVVLRGQIDLWYEHNKDVVIVDYKTDRHADPAPYEIQIQLYTHALTSANRAYLYFLRSNAPVEVNLTPLAISAARETVRDFSRAQESLDFPLKTGTHCTRCDFYGNLCPAGR